MTSQPTTPDESHWLETEAPTDWVSTSHDNVYFREGHAVALPGVDSEQMATAGADIAAALPGDWTVIVTTGPHRGYDVQYTAHLEKNRVNVDFYARRPGYAYLDDVVHEIKAELENGGDGRR